MFKGNNQITKIDANGKFIDLREAFLLGDDGKVVFNFISYDSSKSVGSKVTQQIQIYMDLEEFDYFCELLVTGRIKKLCKAAKENNIYGAGFVKMGGSTKNGQVISRQLKLESSDEDFYIKALQGPGEKDQKGLIKPKYTDKTAEKIIMKISSEQLIKLGLCGKRAINYYDNWNAAGTLKEKVESLQYSKKSSQVQGNVTPIHPVEQEAPKVVNYEECF